MKKGDVYTVYKNNKNEDEVHQGDGREDQMNTDQATIDMGGNNAREDGAPAENAENPAENPDSPAHSILIRRINTLTRLLNIPHIQLFYAYRRAAPQDRRAGG